MTFMWKEINEQPVTLERSFKTNIQTIHDIVNTIHKRDIRFVVIAARGTSDHAGVFGKYIIEYLEGVPVALAAPSIMTVYHRNLNFADSLVIGISQSGEALDVLEIIKEAKKQDAITISITNFENSPLAAAADFHLFLNTGIEYSIAATKTFTAQLFLLSWLAAEWSGDEQLKKDLEMVPNELADLLRGENEVKECAEKYKTMHECFVISRGINYSIALETALKLQETANIHAFAHATSDFYHGPITMIDEHTHIILFAPDGPCFEDIAAMGRKLKEKNAPIITVSNRLETFAFSACILNIPRTANDIISSFYNIIVAQMFSCQITLSKGLNPDLPRGLRKVTVTK